jgi:hypothetical protein
MLSVPDKFYGADLFMAFGYLSEPIDLKKQTSQKEEIPLGNP